MNLHMRQPIILFSLFISTGLAQPSIVTGSFSIPSEMVGLYYFYPLTEKFGLYGSFRTNIKKLPKEKKYKNHDGIDVIEENPLWRQTGDERQYASVAAGVLVNPARRISGYVGVSYTSMTLVEKFQVMNQFSSRNRQYSPIYRSGVSSGLMVRGRDDRIHFMVGYDTYPKGITFGVGLTLVRGQ